MQVLDVSAGSGAKWLREAWQLFTAQPLGWISLTSCWVLLSLVLMIFPLIGMPLALMLQPAFFAGFVLACRDQSLGQNVLVSHLFAGFKQAGRPLIQVGAVALLASLLVQIAVDATGIFSGVPTKGSIQEVADAIRTAIANNFFIWMASVAAQALISGVLWFTSALLAHQVMPASHAIRWSFFAFIGNFVPLLLFGVMLIGLATIAALPLGLGLLIYLPLYAICHYTSFNSVFRASVETAQQN
jgi:uncharacterized membrane protein